jgi:RNAse (barnase) inhibitor barstar
MTEEITIDFAFVKTKKDLFQIFANTFLFPKYFGNNWDAFSDVLSESISQIKDKKIHLILSSYDIFKSQFLDSDREIFESILTEISNDSKQWRDGVLFTFEMK